MQPQNNIPGKQDICQWTENKQKIIFVFFFFLNDKIFLRGVNSFNSMIKQKKKL